MLAEETINAENDTNMTMDNVLGNESGSDQDGQNDESSPTPLSPEEQAQKERHDWINQLRLKFCVRPEFEVTKNIIHPDGRLNQEYFRPPKGYKPEEARKWTDTEKDLLIKGIEEHGIGNFGLISKESLPKWSTNDLRVKCIRLIGRQNLQLYRGWKGNADDIAREYERNKEIGLKYGTWKQGVLVYDDDGLVEKELLATPITAGKQSTDDDVEMDTD